MGPCAKRVVRCILVNDERVVVAVGENLCSTPQNECPRSEGEDYTKCHTVCNQVGHAEEVAIYLARKSLVPLHAYIEGHYRICDNCKTACIEAGVVSFTFGTP